MVFYYQQFFRTALNGIDRSNILPLTVQIGQVILLISFLVAVYESFIRGGDVRMLGIAAVKYVALGLVLLGYATVFRDVNTSFNAFADFISNNTTSGADVFSLWMSDLADFFNANGFQKLFDLIVLPETSSATDFAANNATNFHGSDMNFLAEWNAEVFYVGLAARIHCVSMLILGAALCRESRQDLLGSATFVTVMQSAHF